MRSSSEASRALRRLGAGAHSITGLITTRYAIGELDRPISIYLIEVELAGGLTAGLAGELRPIAASALRRCDDAVVFDVPCSASRPDLAAWKVNDAVFEACGRWPICMAVFDAVGRPPLLVMTSARRSVPAGPQAGAGEGQ